MKKSFSTPENEPDQKKFEIPSEGVHRFQVVDILDNPDPNLVIVKLEVADGDELGRSILHRVSLDEAWKGFFLTRLFLKAIGEPYKGSFDVDSDMWIGKQFIASIIHNKVVKNGVEKTYANIDTYEFDAVTPVGNPDGATTPEMVKWEE